MLRMLVRGACTLVLVACCGAVAAEGRAGLPASASYSEGMATCLKCHDDEHSAAMLAGPHGMAGDSRTPAANRGCEACHGPGGEHAAQGRKFRVAQPFLRGEPAVAAAQSEVCMGCHAQAAQQHFLTSAHSRADVGCADCHAVHAREDTALGRLTQAGMCSGCHTEKKAAMNEFSRHPIREGKVLCTDCHNPHGDKGPHMLVEATVNETCYRCHAEKRGPFLFEHEPVQDDCGECHDPHGSVHEALLTARPPFLCQQCHNEMRHPGTVYANSGYALSNRTVGKGCTNCHTNVHGSNSPSGLTLRR